MHNFRRMVHGQDAQSPHHANASPHGGKAYLELPRLIMKFAKGNALDHSEMQGSPLRVF
jgi:hypothetical protein